MNSSGLSLSETLTFTRGTFPHGSLMEIVIDYPLEGAFKRKHSRVDELLGNGSGKIRHIGLLTKST